MRSLVHRRLAEALCRASGEYVEKLGPSLSFELERAQPDAVFLSLKECLLEWKTPNLFLVKRLNNDKPHMEILNKNDLNEIFSEYSFDEVISILDPKRDEGITFDFDVAPPHAFMVTGWGKYENVPEKFKENFPDGVLFRGN